ncbi:MAG: 50S ribosomal protein L10 [Candidatus Spechtbacterales bacterium]
MWIQLAIDSRRPIRPAEALTPLSVAMSHFFIYSMAISRQKKEEIIKDLEDKLKRHKSAVFVDYSGLDVAGMENIRGELRKEGIDIKVAKKTLLDLILKRLNISIDIKSLSGQVAIVLGYEDEMAPAKIISKFAKELEKLKILGGIFEKGFVGPEKVATLATIPSREELLSRMVGSMQAPMAGMVRVLSGNMRGLVQVLNAISQK